MHSLPGSIELVTDFGDQFLLRWRVFVRGDARSKLSLSYFTIKDISSKCFAVHNLQKRHKSV
jgi:hypothetical protein